jgi:hypothetical protein
VVGEESPASDRAVIQRALKISGQNYSYLYLVARTVADKQANAEITDLTEQAAIPRKAYLESLHQASLAAEVLILPADIPGELETREQTSGAQGSMCPFIGWIGLALAFHHGRSEDGRALTEKCS